MKIKNVNTALNNSREGVTDKVEELFLKVEQKENGEKIEEKISKDIRD